MALNDPYTPYALPTFWDEDLDQQVAGAFGGAAPAPVVEPVVPATIEPAAAPAPDAPDPQVDAWLAQKRGEYERFGASPEDVDKWLAQKKDEYTRFRKQGASTSPSPMSMSRPRTDEARIAQLGAPTGEELPAGALELSEDEAAQIEIDAPAGGSWVHPDFAPPAPQVDAISGADFSNATPPPDDGVRDAFAPHAKLDENQLSPEELGQRWSNLSPEEQAEKRGEIEGGRAELAQAGMVNASTRALKEAESNARAYQQSVKDAQARAAQLDVEAKRLANEKIDPLRDIGVGQKIAGVLAAFIGGFASNKTGRNIGLEAVDSMINDSLQVQTANLNNQKDMLGRRQNAIADEMAKGKDLYQAQETVRLATYDQLIKKLETEVQQFDPRGTRALKSMDAINQAKAARAAAAQKAMIEDQKRIEAQLKIQIDAATLDETIRNNKADNRNDATRAYADMIRAKAEKAKADAEADPTVWTPEQLQQMYGAAADQVPPVPMSRKQYSKWLGDKKSVVELTGSEAQQRKGKADASEAEAKASAAEKGYFVNNPETGLPFTGKDGKPVPVMDVAKREKIDKLAGAAKNLRIVADRIEALKNQNGGNWKSLGSAEAQEMQTLVSMVDFETFKLFDLGAPSEGDKALAEGVRGGADPSSFVKGAKGFQTYAAAAETKLNTMLRQAQMEPIKFTRRTDAPKAEKNFVDDIVKRLAKAEYSPYDPVAQPYRAILPQEEQANKRAEEDIFALEAFIDQPGEHGDIARKSLKDLASSAVAPAVRARAKVLLEKLPETNVRGAAAR